MATPKANEFSLSIEEIRSVGTLHNEILIETIDNFQPTSDETMIVDFFTSLKEVSESKAITVPDKSIEDAAEYGDPGKLLMSLKSNKGKELFRKINSIINQGGHYNEIANSLDLIFNDAQQSLTGTERDAILLFCEVSKNSAQLWLPAENGGLGYGDILSDKLRRGNALELREEGSCWNVVIAADGIAAAGYFTGVGLAILAMPGTNVALVTAVGWSAAVSSGYAYLTADECNEE